MISVRLIFFIKQAALDAIERERLQKQRATVTPQLNLEPPSTLHVYVPEHTVNCKVDVFSKMTVDNLLDEIINTIKDMNVDLQGMKEGISKELYGLFVPSLNAWCRPYRKVGEYQLYKKVGFKILF